MKHNLNKKSTMIILMSLMAINIGTNLFNIYSINKYRKKYGDRN